MKPSDHSTEPEMAELPESWKTLPDGTPAPNWVAAVNEARRDIDLDPAEAAEELQGMFSHIAPGVSLANELIADRRAEVRANVAPQGTTTLRSTLGTCPRIATT